PVTFHQEPAVALVHPMVRHPPHVGMRVFPVAWNPHVLTAFPAPISACPDVAGLRRWSVRLHANGRWGYHDRRSSVVSARRRGGNDTAAERDRQHGNCYY